MSYSNVVAIDGPSGSGKSTLAKDLAKKLDLLHVDTGAMFRAIAFLAQDRKLNFESQSELTDFLNSLKLEYQPRPDVLIAESGVVLDSKLRSESISLLASTISQLPEVRTFLLDFQRDLVKDRFCVMEGRDIGTVVFPKAKIKFFVTAKPEIRAKRRVLQLEGSGEKHVAFEKVLSDVIKRDEQDSNRTVAPLAKAEDALLIDSSEMEYEEVLEQMVRVIEERKIL